jgi:hypothetical protein
MVYLILRVRADIAEVDSRRQSMMNGQVRGMIGMILSMIFSGD